MTTLTRKDASALLRNKIVRDDMNDFGQTESSGGAPLKIKTSTNLVLDEKRILSLDASLRRSETRTDDSDETGLIPTGYTIPQNRAIRYERLGQTFASRIRTTVEELVEKAFGVYTDLIPEGAMVEPTPANIEDFAMPIKSLDFCLDIRSIFEQLDEFQVIYVDAQNDPFVGMMIVGKATDGLVIAQSLLVQT